jgi:hypothetical protein
MRTTSRVFASLIGLAFATAIISLGEGTEAAQLDDSSAAASNTTTVDTSHRISGARRGAL